MIVYFSNFLTYFDKQTRNQWYFYYDVWQVNIDLSCRKNYMFMTYIYDKSIQYKYKYSNKALVLYKKQSVSVIYYYIGLEMVLSHLFLGYTSVHIDI